MDDKRGETVHAVATAVLDYMDACARRGSAPLLHDVNAYRMRLNKAKRAGR